MATTNELLAETTGGALTVNLNSRTIDIPASIKNIGVESDDEVLFLPFHLPRYYCAWDLSEFEIRINYLNAKSEGDVYVITEPTLDGADGEIIYFDWLVGRHATAYRGNVTFNICLKKVNEDGVVTQEFNTTPCSLPVLPGLETTDAIVQENLDIFEQIMGEMSRREREIEERIAALEEGGAGGGGNVDLSEYVKNDELEQNVRDIGDEVYATIEEVGNISAALEELHTYAQSLVGGES